MRPLAARRRLAAVETTWPTNGACYSSSSWNKSTAEQLKDIRTKTGVAYFFGQPQVSAKKLTPWRDATNVFSPIFSTLPIHFCFFFFFFVYHFLSKLFLASSTWHSGRCLRNFVAARINQVNHFGGENFTAAQIGHLYFQAAENNCYPRDPDLWSLTLHLTSRT